MFGTTLSIVTLLAVSQAEEVDLVDLLEASPRRSVAAPFALMRSRAGKAARHLVAFGDQVDDLHVNVGEGGVKGADPCLDGGCDLRHAELIHELHLAIVDDLDDQPADDLLVAFLVAR
jgi:hypothetical protein